MKSLISISRTGLPAQSSRISTSYSVVRHDPACTALRSMYPEFEKMGLCTSPSLGGNRLWMTVNYVCTEYSVPFRVDCHSHGRGPERKNNKMRFEHLGALGWIVRTSTIDRINGS